MAGLVFGYGGAERMHIEGYREERGTITPIRMTLGTTYQGTASLERLLGVLYFSMGESP